MQDSGHDLDQRRFPCAVLADQRNDFAGIESQADAAQRSYSWKAFADFGEGEARFPARRNLTRRLGKVRRSRHSSKPTPLSRRATPENRSGRNRETLPLRTELDNVRLSDVPAAASKRGSRTINSE